MEKVNKIQLLQIENNKLKKQLNFILSDNFTVVKRKVKNHKAREIKKTLKRMLKLNKKRKFKIYLTN